MPGGDLTVPAEADMSEVIMVILRLFRGLECVDTGLTPSQYRIMKLAGAGGERSTRLAQRLAVAKPTLTATADGLVAAGYACRAAEPGDRRVVRLSLTPAGRAALDRADAAYADWLAPLLDATGDRGAVLDALGLLGSAMTEARRARQCLAPRDGGGADGDAGTHGDRKEETHGHRTADHHDDAAQREGGG
jgi:DNA-binding MarR family transcriptional regulator